jgi:hypothetical protein
MNFDSCEIVEQGGKYQQKHESPIPAGIEEITGNEQQEILQFQILVGNKPIEYKYQRKKNGKVDGIK